MRIVGAAPVALDVPGLKVTCDPTRRRCTMEIPAAEHDKWTRVEGKPERPEWHSPTCPDRALLEQLWYHIGILQKVYPDTPIPELMRQVPNLVNLVGHDPTVGPEEVPEHPWMAPPPNIQEMRKHRKKGRMRSQVPATYTRAFDLDGYKKR